MSLRPQQERAITEVRAAFRRCRRVLLVAPTAFGKTATAAQIIAWAVARGRRVLFLVHRREIVLDTHRRLPGSGLVMAGERVTEAPAQVASIQTVVAREQHPPADLVVWDEAHHCDADTYRAVAAQYPNAWHLGLSVGPQAWVEMRGGPMGDGFIGPIEEAYERARAAGIVAEPLGTFDCLRVEALGIEARGWSGSAFAWKRVRSMLRHACDRPTRVLRVAGAELLVTDDHSVYRVEGKPGGACSFVSRPSSDFGVGDVVSVDAGDGWDGVEAPVDLVALLDLPAAQVAVDLADATRRDLGMSPKRWYAARHRGAHGHHLPTAVYRSATARLPRPTRLYTEGARGHWIAPAFPLSDWAYVLGFWLGNGWVSENRVCFSVKNADADCFGAVLAALPHIGWTVTRRQMKGSVEFRCSSSPCAALLRAIFGKVEAHEKFIPAAWITTWSERARRALLDGLMDSDGHAARRERNRERCHFTTTSECLARGLLVLLRSLGVSGSFCRRKTGEGGVVNGRRIVGKHPALGVHWSLHALRGDNERHRGARRRYDHGALRFNESVVRAVTPCEAPAFVYDLEMDGHPSFVADGVLVHNTATPQRADGAGLRDAFDEIVVGATVAELVEGGYLAPVDLVHPPKRLAGIAVNAVDAWIAHAGGRPTVAFHGTVAESRGFVEGIAARGIEARHIDGGTRTRERDDALRLFAAGRVQVLSNAFVLTEGWDCPRAKVCLLARGCGSDATFLQMVGRVRRVEQSGERALIIDLAGVVHEHGHPDEPREYTLDGIRRTRSDRPWITQCQACGCVVEGAKRGLRCPMCGAAWPTPKPVRVQRAALGASVIVPRAVKDARLRALLATAEERGYRTGWVGVRFKEEFGHWPAGLPSAFGRAS